VILKIRTFPLDRNYPEDIEEFKKNYFEKNKSIDFLSLLEYIWNLGITVLPLNDSGIFHGASWNIEGKHVIVLKQITTSHARWIFDLLHEIYHVLVHLNKLNTSVIETEEITPFSNGTTEELEANAFANQVLFEDKAEELADKSVKAANYKLENLKQAVIQVSKKENIRADFLANYLAFRLKDQGENWWGAASNMQVTVPTPFTIASDFLKSKIVIQKLNPIDCNLLNAAITN
jgi:Zn-dependent peptidase ImmA (M78 family)